MTNHDRLLAILATTNTDECVIAPGRPMTSGYGQFTYKSRHYYAHVFACEAAHGPRPAGLEAAHSCGNPPCVNPRHLRWATPKENTADQVIHGTRCRGIKHHFVKLSEADVREIRILLATGLPQHIIAARFSVSRSAVLSINTNRSWRWLC